MVTDASGNTVGETRYYATGETRLSTGSMFTDRLFTGQREMAGLGIYHYGARFYSPKLGRFLSADTIIQNLANPQLLNRYSYVNNNPLRYTDPTGHMMWEGDGGSGTTTGGGDDWWNDDEGSGSGGGGTTTGGGVDDGGGGSADGDGGGGGVVSNTISSCPTCLSIPEPDAYYGSLSLSAGIGPWYGAWSFDMVVTNDQIGLFAVNSLGPGFDGDEYFPLGNLNDYESTFMTPQIGATLYGGGLWGNALQVNVENYEGPALILGAGGGSPVGLDAEYFSSVDPQTGMVDGNIQGFGAGPSLGPQPAEFHIIYGDAVYQPGLSYAATTIGGWLGIVQP